MLAHSPRTGISNPQLWHCRQTQSLLLGAIPGTSVPQGNEPGTGKASSNWFCTWRRYQNPSTAYGGTASFRAELSLLTLSCLLTNPRPSLCCSHAGTTKIKQKNGHKFALLFPFFHFITHGFACITPCAVPEPQEPALGGTK